MTAHTPDRLHFVESAKSPVRRISMDEDELSTQSFVVRIWPEAIDHGPAGWRGHIIHVRGNEDRYFEELDAIPEFIRPFLSKMGLHARSLPLAARWFRVFIRALSSGKRG